MTVPTLEPWTIEFLRLFPLPSSPRPRAWPRGMLPTLDPSDVPLAEALVALAVERRKRAMADSVIEELAEELRKRDELSIEALLDGF